MFDTLTKYKTLRAGAAVVLAVAVLLPAAVAVAHAGATAHGAAASRARAIAKAAAVTLSPCKTPFRSGHWSGTWNENGGGGGPTTTIDNSAKPFDAPRSGTWVAELILDTKGGILGSLSMRQNTGSTSVSILSPSPATVTGTALCQAPAQQVRLSFNTTPSTVVFAGTLSDNGLQLVSGSYAVDTNHGTMQGAFTPTPNGVTVGCRAGARCRAAVSIAATTHAPSETVTVSGQVSDPIGTLALSIASGSLPGTAARPRAARVASGCRKMPSGFARVGSLTDSGFAKTTSLSLTVTLHSAAESNPAGVCFNSEAPFLSQTNPKVAKAGTGVLLTCAATANVAPCVVSSKQVGTDFVVNFVAPGGDPKFIIFPAKGQVAFVAGFPSAHVGRPYSAQLASSGGKVPIHWKVKSGSPPPGVALSATTGSIRGTPTAKGTSTFVVQATDSAVPKADTAVLTVVIKVS